MSENDILQEYFETFCKENPNANQEAAWHAFRSGFAFGKIYERKYWAAENRKLKDEIDMLSLDIGFLDRHNRS